MFFRVVEMGASKPVTGGIQVAADLEATTEPPAHYSFRLDDQGHAVFSGGQLHEITPEGTNGLYRIDNVPEEFVIAVEFGRSGTAAAKIYRRCYVPETLLEYATFPDSIEQGGAWNG